jgi:diguanylate cyclase (GGDEF)-like protein/PAS domain S-box-containing protein
MSGVERDRVVAVGAPVERRAAKERALRISLHPARTPVTLCLDAAGARPYDRVGASRAGSARTMIGGMGRLDPPRRDERSAGSPAPSRARDDSLQRIDALQRMAALVEFSEDPIIGLTLDGRVTDWNPAAERVYGYSKAEMLGASVAVLVPPELRGRTGNLLERVRTGEVIRQLDTQRMAKNGRRIDVSISMTPITDDAGTIIGAAAFTRDITERRRIERELERLNAALVEQARRDPLTGLGNRLRLEEDLAVYDARRVRYGHSYCVLLCDLDRFKALNDRDGHHAGDRVLCEVASTLQRQSRSSDGVYRYGGEEFLVLLAESNLEGATVVAERIRRAVRGLGLAHEDNEAGIVTISIGAAQCPRGDRTDPADAIVRADQALYFAKAQGRDRVVADS